jgi:hypothetical protein
MEELMPTPLPWQCLLAIFLLLLALGQPLLRAIFVRSLQFPPPYSSSSSDDLSQVFYRMGLGDKEIVALSGAHTLGRARTSRSGFGKEVSSLLPRLFFSFSLSLSLCR